MSDAERIRRELDRIVRRERGRLVAGLAARLGPVRIDVAEDVAQEALLQALEGWDYKGMPDQPAAWLARVARNKAIDRLRREGREDGDLVQLHWPDEGGHRSAKSLGKSEELRKGEMTRKLKTCRKTETLRAPTGVHFKHQ